MRRLAGSSLALVVLMSLLALPASAQRQGEYLSPGEQDLIRDAQEIVPRAKVFVRLAGRRVLALTGGAQDKKDEELFGPLPTGSQAELLDDYRRVLEEYMNKVDDHYERKGNSKDMGRAMRLTVDGIEAHLKALAALRPQLTDERAVHYYGKAVEAAEIVLEGVRPLASTDEKK